jgi:NTE family protein
LEGGREVKSPRVELAVAIGASSAFPPVLSPVRLKLKSSDYSPPEASADLHSEPYTTDVVLTDGGVILLAEKQGSLGK